MHHRTIDGADISYSDVGTGPVIVFVHGVYVTGALWADAVAKLSDRYRCISPTWPLGAHHPVGDGVDLRVETTARRVVHFLDELDLRDVTLVANDTGGGVVLTALGDPSLDTSRIGRLVFTNSDSYEHFPPGSFRHIVTVCRKSAAIGGAILRGLATSAGQRFFLGVVCRDAKRISPTFREEIFGEFASSAATRREAVRVTASLDPRLTLAASEAIESFDRPVTLAWGTADKLFPISHAHRLAEAFGNSRLIEIENSSSYVMVDAPDQLAAAISSSITQ
jgi:pimeloyl-ACP methyl ester carboxylesterase